MTKKYYLLKSLASLMAMIFGFSATVAAQYGAIETTYKINGNINDYLSDVPLKGIKVSMKANDLLKTTTQSDSLGHFEFEVNGWGVDNTYYFNAEDIDGAANLGSYLPKDTSLQLDYADFQQTEPRGHWQIERKCRYEVNLRLPKAEVATDTVDPPVKPTAGKDSIHPELIVLPKDTLPVVAPEVTTEIPLEDWTMAEVYPNPTNGLVEIVIESRMAEEISLQLYDDNYKALFEKTEHLQIGSNQFTVDLKGYPAGNYFLMVIRRDNRMVKKIVKI
jgi:putative lipoprotein (rSAM/lipoprotein system)